MMHLRVDRLRQRGRSTVEPTQELARNIAYDAPNGLGRRFLFRSTGLPGSDLPDAEALPNSGHASHPGQTAGSHHPRSGARRPRQADAASMKTSSLWSSGRPQRHSTPLRCP